MKNSIFQKMFARIFYTGSGLYTRPNLPKLTRDNDLDLMRFLLAACVVFYHSKTLIGGLDFTFSRISAVPIFLFLSGMLITESFYGSPDLKAYTEKRIRRIYPAYLAVVVFGGLLAFVGWRVLGGEATTIANLGKYLFANSLFANWIVPCVATNIGDATQHCTVNGSLWVMKWEVLFYASIPLLLLILSRLNKVLYVILLFVLAARVSVEASPYIRIFLCFLMGICAFYLKSLWIPALKKLPAIPPLVRQGLLFAAFFLAQYVPYGFFILILMFVAFYPTSEGKGINTLKFGDISYGVFLIHFPLITSVFQFLPYSMFGASVSFIILAISIFLSILMYKFIEAPFLLPSSHYRKASGVKLAE